MRVKLVDIVAQYEEIKKDGLFEIWDRVLKSGNLYLGENVSKFEEEFADYLGVKYVIGVGSGTDALYLALKAQGITRGDEVITVSFTFIATIEAILLCGARPVFIDICPKTYTMRPELIREHITKRTKVILPVHLYGHPANLEPIIQIAKEYNLSVLEDAAQAHGAYYLLSNNIWVHTGTLGDVSTFSFYFSKNLSALGEAGAVATNSEELAHKLRLLREHGQTDKYTHELIGHNSRLDELQAVVLRLKLKYLNSWNEKRREIAKYYNNNLKGYIHLPEEAEWARHSYHLYVIRCADNNIRNELFSYLRGEGIEVGIHYPLPCHLQPAIRKYHNKNSKLSTTEKLAKEVLSLPIHPYLEKEDLDFCIEKIHKFFLKRSKIKY